MQISFNLGRGKDTNSQLTAKFLSQYDVDNSILYDTSRKTTTKTRLKCEGKNAS